MLTCSPPPPDPFEKAAAANSHPIFFPRRRLKPSRSKKENSAGESQPPSASPAVVALQIFSHRLAGHCCGGVGCARLQKMPANSASLAC